MKVVVLMGGSSDERAVSLASGSQIARALRTRGHEVFAVDTVAGLLSSEEELVLLNDGVGIQPPRDAYLAELSNTRVATLASEPPLVDADVFFVALHGGAGENGAIQGLLDMVGVAYTGSDRLGCSLAMDKEVSKRLFREAGVPTPDWLTGRDRMSRSPSLAADSKAATCLAREIESLLGLPVIVKAAAGGSSLRLVLAHDLTELEHAVRASRRWNDEVVFERYQPGREFTVGIVGDEPLPVGEIVPRAEYFDYESKYQPGMAEEIFPARIDGGLADRLGELALRAFRALRMRDYGRVDFMVGDDGAPWCLEANAAPGMTATSLLPKAAAAAGISFAGLCERISDMAVGRRRYPSSPGHPATTNEER